MSRQQTSAEKSLVTPESPISEYPECGRIVLQASGIYGVFQSSLPGEESYLLGSQWFTYGLLEISMEAPDALRLVRSEDGEHLLPGGDIFGSQEREAARISNPARSRSIEYRSHILAMRTEAVPDFVPRLGKSAARAAADASPPAERLYQAARAARLEVAGAPIDTCVTISGSVHDPKIIIVDPHGGYSIGLPPSEGIATDADLLRHKTAV